MSIAASTAFATTVQPNQGRVLINRGSGFQGAAGPTSVSPGDRVMVNAGSSATIQYDNGCVEQVEAGQIRVVKSEITCATGLFGDGATPYVVGAAVVGGGVALAVGLSGKSSGPASP